LARSDNAENVDLFQASKARWKKMRNIMNPTFSSLKLKEVSHKSFINWLEFQIKKILMVAFDFLADANTCNVCRSFDQSARNKREQGIKCTSIFQEVHYGFNMELRFWH